MMKTTIERINDDTLRLDIEVPTEVIQDAVEMTLHSMGRDMRVPGFRPGKVPPQAVLARIGKEAAMQQAVQQHLGNWYVSAIAASGIRPISEPEIDLTGSIEEDKPLQFSATVTVAPKPKLPELKTLEVDRPKLPDLTPYVDQVLAATLRAAGKLKPTGKPAETGDEVLVDFQCLVDDNPVRGASAIGYEAKLGDGRLLDELEAAILGKESGNDLTVPVNFPPDHPMSDLAGKAAEFKLKLREVQTLELPDLNDDIAKKVSEFSTKKELLADIEGSIAKRITGEIDGVFRGNAVNKLAEVAEVNEPQELVDRRQQEAYAHFKDQLSQHGFTIETWMARSGQSQDTLIDDLEKQAREEVRRELTLTALAEDADIAVSQEQLEAEVREHTEQSGEDFVATMDHLNRSGRADMLRGELLIQRTIDYLVQQVKAVEVDVPTVDEAAQQADDTAEGDKADEAGQTQEKSD